VRGDTLTVASEAQKQPDNQKQPMGGLDFISGAISSLAWPLLIVFLYVVLRKRINPLLDRINEVSINSVSLKFDNGLDDARQNEMLAWKEQERAPPIHSLSVGDPIILNAQADPQTYIISSFVIIDRELARFYKLLHQDTEFRDGAELMQELKTKDIISENAYLWFLKLRRLRNLAEHSSSEKLGTSIAVNYRLQCLTFVNYILEVESKYNHNKVNNH
jgi:hypothetical protein